MKPLSMIIIKLTPYGKKRAEDVLSATPESTIISQLEMRDQMNARQAISSVGLGEEEGRALLVNMSKRKLITTSNVDDEAG
ncbi:MAG: hypothetical protein US53_C0036G0013 [Candidatus Woesebacteria bacterium GW2011_GWA1_37_7]|uniref:Uncharacterized protein n=1 Tax=Candidatus Woesebacteria bacterium GW2011_GWA1_37_7 TaxID=1618545 RepID=A0A0G0K891_9BACT|nr:MAG: hypothetical protein US53_C0036G0013 [Candidatus Woesebacteria bacterium GW2011_GWA1_37_7]